MHVFVSYALAKCSVVQEKTTAAEQIIVKSLSPGNNLEEIKPDPSKFWVSLNYLQQTYKMNAD